jgi:type II secretory pathway component PulK
MAGVFADQHMGQETRSDALDEARWQQGLCMSSRSLRSSPILCILPTVRLSAGLATPSRILAACFSFSIST